MLTTLACAAGFSDTLLRATMGTGLDTTAARSAIGLEAKSIHAVTERDWAELSARADRPFDSHENFYVPYLKATFSGRLLTRGQYFADLRPWLSLLSLDRWSYDGFRGRVGVNGVWQWLPHPNLTLQAEIAPWLEASQYRTSPEGKEFPLLGLTQKITAEGRWNSAFLELSISAQQSYRSQWRNDLGFQQRIGYRINPSIAAGLSHEIISGRLDESTGYLRTVGLFDSRLSRISVFGEFIL